MAIGGGSLRTRAASLLHPYISAQTHSQGQQTNLGRSATAPTTQPADLFMNGKGDCQDRQASNGEESRSLSTAGKTVHSSNNDVVAQNKRAQRVVRTIPPWVELLDDTQDTNSNTHLLPHSPQHAQIAQHNNSPSALNKERPEAYRGRLPDLDGARTRPGSPTKESRWKAFAQASAYPAVSANGGKRVTEEWLIQNGPDYSRAWLENNGAKDEEQNFLGVRRKRKRWWIRYQRKIIRSPMIPLVLRSIVWAFSFVALALGSSISQLTAKASRDDDKIRNTPSTDMAIIVDALALVYLLYITYDEYTGKPLGLRSAIAKMRLVFLDLFFIVFDSANLSLAMEATSSSDSHGLCQQNDSICDRQKTLASVLLIALIAWLLTFSISVFRLVERVTHK